MDWIKLSEPVKANLVFSPEMREHPLLRCLRYFSKGGRVEVEILAFKDVPDGRLCLFRPIKCPGVQREALMQYFAPPASPSEELLSLE